MLLLRQTYVRYFYHPVSFNMILICYFSILRRFSHTEWEYLTVSVKPCDVSGMCLPLQTQCNFSVSSYLLIQLQPEVFHLIIISSTCSSSSLQT